VAGGRGGAGPVVRTGRTVAPCSSSGGGGSGGGGGGGGRLGWQHPARSRPRTGTVVVVVLSTLAPTDRPTAHTAARCSFENARSLSRSVARLTRLDLVKNNHSIIED